MDGPQEMMGGRNVLSEGVYSQNDKGTVQSSQGLVSHE